MTPKAALSLSYNNPQEFNIRKYYYERIISKDSYYSFQYSMYKLRDRFELGEPTIAKNNWSSLNYSTNVLRDRFELGENIISTSLRSVRIYYEEIVKEISTDKPSFYYKFI